MNGARALIQTLVDCGVDVCFANPGTSEMHFVAALDDVPQMRGVLALFEGVATGAADGYARMTGRPGGVLLHLGPGLGNGLANLHNARRARSPVLAVVGDHATTTSVRRAARVRHRDHRARRIGVVPGVAREPRRRQRCRGRRRGGAGAARPGRDPGAAGRRVVVRGRGSRRPAARRRWRPSRRESSRRSPPRCGSGDPRVLCWAAARWASPG